MKTFKSIILWIWQLPQNLLGLAFMLFLRPLRRVETDIDTIAAVYVSERMSGGISLGDYAYVSKVSSRDEKTIRHEGIGHPRQSRMLGPLYLLVIGLPSLLHAWLNGAIGCCDRHPDGYYHFYTESWADRLGGVKRQ